MRVVSYRLYSCSSMPKIYKAHLRERAVVWQRISLVFSSSVPITCGHRHTNRRIIFVSD
jgi:hypothetical protein